MTFGRRQSRTLAPTAALSEIRGSFWKTGLYLTISLVFVVGGLAMLHDPEAKTRSANFRKARIPKFLGWFETVIARNGGRWLVGERVSYADLSLFHLVTGLAYAFPKAAKRALAKTPRVAALGVAVADLPRIAAYLDSPRRLAFSEEGIFRRYPELDG